jgi:hypothetical protein
MALTSEIRDNLGTTLRSPRIGIGPRFDFGRLPAPARSSWAARRITLVSKPPPRRTRASTSYARRLGFLQKPKGEG